MDAHKNELILDLEEIKKFEASAQRESVRGKLAVWRSQIEQELSALESKVATPVEGEAAKAPAKPKLFTKKITTYAWDQSNKFVKVFVSGLKGVGGIPADRVSLSFDGNHYTLNVHDLNNSNYQFSLPKLLHKVIDASIKIKENEVVIMLKKDIPPKTWDTLSAMEKQQKDEERRKNEPNMDKNADPNKGLMDLMKKMYDEGDDDMKRTIAKAWTESREKQATGEGGPSF